MNKLKIQSFVADPPHEVCLLGSGVFCHGGLAKPSCCIDACHSAVDEPENSFAARTIICRGAGRVQSIAVEAHLRQFIKLMVGLWILLC